MGAIGYPRPGGTFGSQTRKWSVLQVNTNDVGGGAATCAWNLLRGYQEAGLSSWLAVGRKSTSHDRVVEIPGARAWPPYARIPWALYGRTQRLDGIPGMAWFRESLHTLASGDALVDRWLGRESFDFPPSHRVLQLVPQRVDLVHCHNLHGGYFDLRALVSLSQKVPVVTTLHDAWLLTGHCAHPIDCQRWRAGCGECPDLKRYPDLYRDGTAANWQRKRAIYAQSQLYLATPSRWLSEIVQQSILRDCSLRVIPNGIDLEHFAPGNRAEARKGLDLPLDGQIVLYVGSSQRKTTGCYKDPETLRRAFAFICSQIDREVTLVCVGQTPEPLRSGQPNIRYAGTEQDHARMLLYYQAADVYLHAARAENYPYVVLEAMACGLPVVATAVGGIPEQVEHGVTGFTASRGDAEGLAGYAVRLLGDEPLRQGMGEEAYRVASERFCFKHQVDAYLDWFAELRDRYRGLE